MKKQFKSVRAILAVMMCLVVLIAATPAIFAASGSLTDPHTTLPGNLSISTPKGADAPAYYNPIPITLRNNGTQDMTLSNLSISGKTLSTSTTETEIVALDDLSGDIVIPAGDKVELRFAVLTRGKPSSIINFTVNFRLGDSYYRYAHQVTIKTEGVAANKPQLTVAGFGTSPRQIVAGSEFDLIVAIQNIAEELSSAYNVNASNVKVTFKSEHFTNVNASSTVHLQTLNAQSGARAGIKLRAKSDLAKGYYPLTVTIDYEDVNGEAGTVTETIQIAVTDMGSAFLKVGKTTMSPTTASAGDPFSLSVDLENQSMQWSARDVKVTFTGAEDQFTILGSGTKFIPSITGGSKTTVLMDILPASTLKTASYSIDMAVEYKDANGRTYTFTQSIPISVAASGQADSDLIVGYNMSTPRGNYGQKISFGVPVFNQGANDVFNVTVTPVITSSSATFPFDVTQVHYKKELGTIGGAQSKSGSSRTGEAKFDMTFRSDMDAGYYPVTFHVTYQRVNDPSAPKVEFDQIILMQVVKGKPEPTDGTSDPKAESVPRVIVSGYRTDVEKVMAGEPFKLTIEITNTSETQKVQNMKIQVKPVDPESQPFLPVSGSSTMFLNGIEPGEKAELEIGMVAGAELVPKSYQLAIAIDYENPKATALTSTETISIPVNQLARLVIAEPQINPQSLEVYQETNIMVNIYNMGKSKLNNVMVHVESKGMLQCEDFFIGNMDSGASKLMDVYAMALMTGFEECEIQVTFENEIGEQFLETFAFNLDVYEGMNAERDPGMTDPGMIDPETGKPIAIGPDGMPIFSEGDPANGEGGIPWLWIGIGAGALVLVGGIVTIVVVRKKKKKKMENVDDFLDDLDDNTPSTPN